MRLVRGLDAQLTAEWLGRDLVSLSLSPLHLLTGHSSGSVTLYRRRDSFSLVKKISRRVTSRDNLSVVSLAPGLVCVGCRTGDVVLLHLSPVTVTVFSIQERVTALSGSSGTDIYVGGEKGCVAVYSSQTRDTRQILDLGASVVQIEVSGDTVVTSSTATSVICNTKQRTFRQVGTKQSSGHPHGLSISGGHIWTSRPGARFWQVDINTGEVLATVKYKQVLDTLQPCQIIDEALEPPTFSTSQEHSFSSLSTNDSGLAVTFNISGNIIYILDLQQSKVVAWTPVTHLQIREAHIEGDLVLILGSRGELLSLRFGEILQLSRHCLHLGREDLLLSLLTSADGEDGGLTGHSQLDLAKLYLLCLRLHPSLTQMENDILKRLGGSAEFLSRSLPTRTSWQASEEEDMNKARSVAAVVHLPYIVQIVHVQFQKIFRVCQPGFANCSRKSGAYQICKQKFLKLE